MSRLLRLPRLWRRRRSIESQNSWYLYLDIAWFGILVGVYSTFAKVFVVRLGGSNELVGLLTALPALISVVWLIPAARLIERQPIRPVILITGFLMRFGYCLVALLPLVLATDRAEAVVAVITLITFPQAMGNVAFTSMMADVVSPERRATVISIRNVLLGLTGMITSFVGGWFLDHVTFPINYQILFGVGFLASLVSLHYVSRIRMPDRHPVPQAVELARSLSQRLRDFKQMIFSSRDFVRFSTASLVFYWGLWFPIPLYSIFWVKTLHASDYWIGLLATVSSAVTIGTYYWWGRVATRRGNRIVLLISTLGMSLYPILTGIAPSVEFLLIPSITSGLLATGFDIATLNATLAVCPKERRPMFVAVYNVLNNLAAFVAPLLGVALAGQVGLPLALLTGGAFRILGFLCFYFLPLQADRTLSAQWD